MAQHPTIDLAFIKQFEDDVHEAYQRRGSKLRGMVRNKTGITGISTSFQKVGKGTATTKSRHGVIDPMNVDHEPVECLLADYYAGDWVDRLDELKTNIDERTVVTSAGAYALGRKTDELIVSALDSAATNVIAVDAAGLTLTKILTAMETLGNAEVPEDDRFAVVGWRQWAELLKIDEFSDADYIGTSEDMPWLQAGMAKRWLGTIWMPFSGLTLAGTTRSCFWFHKTAIGHASGAEVQTDITWHGDRAAHWCNNMMSQGAVLIDDQGIVKIQCLEES